MREPTRQPRTGGRVGTGQEPAASTAKTAETAEARTARGRAGEAMPPRGGTKKEDDKEHTTPEYLKSQENGNKIVGEMEPVSPPVIGQ